MPCLSSSTITSQIHFLIQSLTDSNIDDVLRELCKFIDIGIDRRIFLLQTCINHLSCPRTDSRDLKNVPLDQVYISLFKYMMNKPNFSTVFCESIRNTPTTEGFLESLSNALNLSLPEKIGMGLAFADSDISGIKTLGDLFCLSQIEELRANPVSMNSTDQIQNIIMFLRKSEGFSKHVEYFMQILSSVPLKENTQFLLSPLLSNDSREANLFRDSDFFSKESKDNFDGILAEMDNEISMNDVIMELGYGCTVSSLQCKEILSRFLPLTEVSIAKVLATIASTQSGLEEQENLSLTLRLAFGSNMLSDLQSMSSWNVDPLIDSINELFPGINWTHVFENMDHNGFYLPNEEAFSFLMSIYRRVSQDPFPLSSICGFVWNNTEGQLSFLKYAVSAPPEVFSFAHSTRQLGYMNVVHEDKFQLGHSNNAWLCLDLLTVLCELAERGHVRSVKSMLEFPLEYCPEILLLGLANINTAYNLIQYEVFSSVFPVVIGKAMGDGWILQIWHVNPKLVIRGFVEAHSLNPENITIILNICRDSKILSVVLEMTPSAFSIRLAALASLERLVDLEKWLENNLSKYKDSFFNECIWFFNGMQLNDAGSNIYSETSSTFTKFLQAPANLPSSSHVSEEIRRTNETDLLADSNLENESTAKPEVSGGYADNIYDDTKSEQQISLPSQHQQKHLSTIEERRMTSPEQPSPERLMTSDVIQKSQNPVSGSATLSSPSNGFGQPSRGMLRPLFPNTGFGSAMNIGTLVAAAEKRGTPIEAPSSEVQDKISFIINNISTSNLETKAKEFSEIINEKHYPWFAQYMVMKRASIEPNFHELYLKFLETVNSKALNKEILQATYENCKVLLGSELIKSSSEERSLLKNLGSLLGKFTIGRNRVLRAREIHCKSLIIEAYEKGLMIALIPFTSKILEACQTSEAYQPPNPWTMGILSLLVEIYKTPNLKMNLYFDIEVLFKNLGVDMKDVRPSSLLNNRKRAIEGNPDFSNKDISIPQPQIVAEVKAAPSVSSHNQIELPLKLTSPSVSGVNNILSSQAPRHIPSSMLTEGENLTGLGLSNQVSTTQGQLPTPIPNIGAHVIINSNLNSSSLYLIFQRVLPIVMDRAIKEVLASIIQRCVEVTTQTTKMLVLKDFAMESEEDRIFNAAHLMVASLSASLAHATCKERLRDCISGQLRNSLQDLSIGSDVLEDAIKLVTNDNLDMGCAVIEHAATTKAIETIDEEIGQELSLRRHRREAAAPTFFNSNIYSQSSMGAIPEELRLKPGKLSLSQLCIYEDFVKFPWLHQKDQSSTVTPASPSALSSSTGLSPLHGLQFGQHNPGALSSGFENTTSQRKLVCDELDSSSTLPASSSLTHIAATDGVTQQVVENPVVSLYSSIGSPAPKESKTSAQPLSSIFAAEQFGSTTSESLLTTRDALDRFQMVAQKCETIVGNDDTTETGIQEVIAEVPEILLKCIRRDEAALAMAQKVFKELYENTSSRLRVETLLAILASIRDAYKLVVNELTTWVICSNEDRKFNKDIIMGLIRGELLNLAEYNLHMAQLVDSGRNKAATEFSISLLQTLVIEEPRVVSELHNLFDVLKKLALRPGSPESLQQLINSVENPSGFVSEKEEKSQLAKDDSYVELDPAVFREQVSALFTEWYKICEIPGSNDAACAHYILKLQHNGFLKGDDFSDHFFLILTEISVTHFLSSEAIISESVQSQQEVQPMYFLAIDIYSKLVFSILEYGPVVRGSSDLFIFSKVLAATVRYIQRDAEEKKGSFNARPYFRFFINLLRDLNSFDRVFNDDTSLQCLLIIESAFLNLQPLNVPAFSFAWLKLISHKYFMPKLLTLNPPKGWPYFQRLLVALFQFFEPFLRNAKLGEPVRYLYLGTLRVLLVLLNDFPEFLGYYHFNFCGVIPYKSVQMRNLILSASPRNTRVLNPLSSNIKIDMLPEASESPRILSEVDAALKMRQMKNEVDEYIKCVVQTGQQGSPFLTDLKRRLLLPPNEAASSWTRYDVPLINSLVLYVGIQVIQHLEARTQSKLDPMILMIGGADLDIFQTLAVELDTEGRYLYLNAIADQLRYPNSHTHYFSCLLLFLFKHFDQEIIKEQITRVLVERINCNEPHPWGVIATTLELMKNPKYHFWSQPFIRCAPDIEKMFEKLSKSMDVPNTGL